MKDQVQDIQFTRLNEGSESLIALRDLNILFAEAFNEPDTYLGGKPSDEYLLSLLSKKHIIVCVATVNQKVVAGLVGYVMEKFEKERSEVYIYDLAVEEDYRRKQIATNLILFLKDEAVKAGAWVVFIQADPEDTPAIRLYESLGIREEVFHFDIAIE
ncbi:GNAT family N-acetyltransferase [Alkalibacterium sp. f15]|uniref:GNAT family N-acetyltransferase n=1 Tax=Alkalibacterium sp. f15 TaxID=3414029 RepID=UPI003BF86082